MSRKDNGLHATSYTRLLDVESPLVDGLLERLRDEEVAAYVAPAPGRRGPYGDTVLPGSPSDSVYVDAARREQARDVADRYLAEIREELAWADIVAGYDDPSPVAGGAWPEAEDVAPEPEGEQSDRTPRTGRVLRPADTSNGFEELRDVGPRNPADDPEDHFQPPSPPPVPLPDPVTRFAWAALLGGPLFLLLATVFAIDISGWLGFLGFLAFVGGFVTLVARMQDRPPNDLGGDDGAVV